MTECEIKVPVEEIDVILYRLMNAKEQHEEEMKWYDVFVSVQKKENHSEEDIRKMWESMTRDEQKGFYYTYK